MIHKLGIIVELTLWIMGIGFIIIMKIICFINRCIVGKTDHDVGTQISFTVDGNISFV